MNLRFKAAHIIQEVVFDGKSLSVCLPAQLPGFSDKRDQALLQAICFGVCRFYFELEALLKLLLLKPLKAKDQDLHSLLLVGLYQLSHMRIPSHAVVAETVSATPKKWAKNLVNAILRRFLRQKDTLITQIQQEITAQFDHPLWMIDLIKKDWPDHWAAILMANNAPPPFALRVNQKNHSRDDYLKKVTADPIAFTKQGIVLQEPIDVTQLPGFAAGDISVQDGAAQLAVDLLELSPNLTVLDACAAPGGKTTHLLENEPTLHVTAVDQNADRLQILRDNLTRLHLAAEIICTDAKKISADHLFDRILLDVPCSASGVIRRHPDIKLLRKSTDIATLAQEQLALLQAVWQHLKPNGLLLYVTCSIFTEENSVNLVQFLKYHPDAREEKIESQWGISCIIGKQILPGTDSMDGFYYARLRKGE